MRTIKRLFFLKNLLHLKNHYATIISNISGNSEVLIARLSSNICSDSDPLDPAYREMDTDTYDVIAQYTNTNELMQIKEYGKKEGKVDMCMAITELIERGRRQGIEQGIEQVIKALIETSHEFGSTKEETIGRITEKIQISGDVAEVYVGKYWT